MKVAYCMQHTQKINKSQNIPFTMILEKAFDTQ